MSCSWRNVLIYFDIETKKTIFTQIRRLLRPDGYLLLGGAETTTTLTNHLKRSLALKDLLLP